MRGFVVKKTVAPGSKSQRSGYVLKSDKGEFVLRRQGANPFQQDPEFSQVVGREIDVQGKLLDYLFIVDSWKRVDPEQQQSDTSA